MLRINDEKTISFICHEGKLYLPVRAYRFFDKVRNLKEYNSEPGLRIKEENYLKTKATYKDYIEHVIKGGLTTRDYFLESLLHEAFHLCGSCGGYPLFEGINELKTRELAYKQKIVIAATGYQKEVEIALKLQEIFGKNGMDVIAFKHNNLEERNIKLC